MTNKAPYIWRMPIFAPFTDALAAPDVDPTDEDGLVSVCFNKAYIPYILGALAVFTYDDAFNLDGDSEPVAVQRFYTLIGLFAAALEGCGLMDFDVRQSEENPCILEKFVDDEWIEFANLRLCPPIVRLNINMQVEISFDNGETFEVLTPNEQPPVPVPDPEFEARCNAAASAVEVLNATYIDVRTYFQNTVAPLVALSGVISFIAVYIFFPPAIPTVLEFFVTLYGLLSEIVDDEFDTDTKNTLRCIFYCHSEQVGDQVNFDFEAIILEIADLWDLTGINIYAAVEYILYIMGEQGLNNSGATGVITDAECDDCGDCLECSSYFDDMETGLGPKTCFGDGLDNWTCGDQGTWEAGFGRTGGGAGVGVPRSPSGKQITMEVDLGMECEVQQIGFWTFRNNIGGTGTWVVQTFDAAHTLVRSEVIPGVNGNWQEFDDNGGWGICQHIYLFFETNVSTDVRMDDIKVIMA